MKRSYGKFVIIKKTMGLEDEEESDLQYSKF